MKFCLCLTIFSLAITSNTVMAELDDELMFLTNEAETKNKPMSYYKELAEREQSITKAAVAVRERMNAGVTLNDDGTWDIKPQRHSAQTYQTNQAVEDKNNVATSEKAIMPEIELGGITFGNSSKSNYSVKHIIGDHAVLVIDGQEIRVKQGDKLESGDTVLSVSLRSVKLMSYEGAEFTIKSKI